MSRRPRLCLDCDAVITRQPGQSDWSWRVTCRCPRCKRVFDAIQARKKARRVRAKLPPMVSASSAAVDVNRAWRKLFGDCVTEAEFARRFDEIHARYAKETNKYHPHFRGPAAFGVEDMRLRGFGGRT